MPVIRHQYNSMFAVLITYNNSVIIIYHLGLELAVVLLSCLSEAVNDQLRVGSERSILTTLVTSKMIHPCSLYMRKCSMCKLVCIQPWNALPLLHAVNSEQVQR